VVAARSSQIDFVIELAAAGVGAAFLPRLLDRRRAGVGVVSLALDEPDVDWRLALVWRKGAYLSDAARAWQALAMTSRFD
jgi:DNA-binding transcriptional LysR family regulator